MMEFTPTYAVSLLLRELPARLAYDSQTFHDYVVATFRYMHEAVDPVWLTRVKAPPWLYPPTYTLLLMPLAMVPFWWAFVLWNLISSVPYLALMARILGWRVGLGVGVSAPPAFYCMFHAQAGFLTTGLLGWGLQNVLQRPWLAGVLIGLATFKPHLGILFPVALAAGGHWRVVVAAVVSGLAFAGMSGVALGGDVWSAYAAGAGEGLKWLSAGMFSWIPMVTPYAALQLAGIAPAVASWIQFVVFLAMVSLVGWVWWRGATRTDTLGLQAAILCLATPLALPMAFVYDLTLIVPAVAWVGRDLVCNGGRRWEWGVLAGSLAAMLLVVTIADLYQVQIAPVLLLVLLGVALRRFVFAISANAMDGRPGRMVASV